MIELAIQEEPKFGISKVDDEIPGLSYLSLTLERLIAKGEGIYFVAWLSSCIAS